MFLLHGPDKPAGPAKRGSLIMPSRRAANKAAATRSAVVPGLRRFPRAQRLVQLLETVAAFLTAGPS